MADISPEDERFAGDVDPDQPLVLVLGFAPPGVTDALKAAGRQYKIKLLESRPLNWAEIITLFEKYDVRCVLANLTGGVYERLADPDYVQFANKLLAEIAARPHLVVAFEALVFPADEGRDSPDGSDRPVDFARTDPEVLRHGKAYLAEFKIRVIPYRRNAEFTILASAFLSDNEEGLVFKAYIPKGRIWSNEFDTFLGLFRDYLSRTHHEPVRLEQLRTDNGTIYKLLADDAAIRSADWKENLVNEIREFSELLHFSVTEPGRAEMILRAKDVGARDVTQVVERYAKEARRLQIDMQHEKESKMLSIQHRLENDLAETHPELSAAEVRRIASSALQESEMGSLPPSVGGLVKGALEPQSVTINVGNVVNAVNSVIAEEISGDVRFGIEDKQILELIRKFEPESEAELGSALRELADETAPRAGRLEGKQKLKAFLYALGDKASDVAVGLLTAYLDKKLGLS